MSNWKTIIECELNIVVLDIPDALVVPSSTYEEFMSIPLLSGNGEEKEGVISVRIDIWHRDRLKVRKLAKRLKERIKQEYGTGNVTTETSYDTSGKIWRSILRFEQIEEEQNVKKECQS